MFCATSIVKNNDKEKWAYSAYRTASDGKGEWSFGNDTAINAVIFCVGNSSSSHANNLSNKFSVLGEGDTFGINGSFAAS